MFGVAYNSCCVDERIDAAIQVSGGPLPFDGGDYEAPPATPMLLVHGTADETVPVGAGDAVFDMVAVPIWYLRIEGATHSGVFAATGALFDKAMLAFLDAELRGDDAARRRWATRSRPAASPNGGSSPPPADPPGRNPENSVIRPGDRSESLPAGSRLGRTTVDTRPVEASSRPPGVATRRAPDPAARRAPPSGATPGTRLRSPYEALRAPRPAARRAHRQVGERGPAAAGVALVAVARRAARAGRQRGAPARGRDEGALVSAAWALGRSLPEAARTVTPVRPSLGDLAARGLGPAHRRLRPGAQCRRRRAGGHGGGHRRQRRPRLGARPPLRPAPWAAAPGVAVVALSPLAADLHRTVHPGALAAPWLLAALRARPVPPTLRRRVGGWRGAARRRRAHLAGRVAAAVPAVALQVWRTPRPSARSRALLSFLAGAAVTAGSLGWLVVLGRGSPLAAGAGPRRARRPAGASVRRRGGRRSPSPWRWSPSPPWWRRSRSAASARSPPRSGRVVALAVTSTAPPTVGARRRPPAGCGAGRRRARGAVVVDAGRPPVAAADVVPRLAGVSIVDGLAPALLVGPRRGGRRVGAPMARHRVDAVAADDDAGMRAAVAWLAANAPDSPAWWSTTRPGSTSCWPASTRAPSSCYDRLPARCSTSTTSSSPPAPPDGGRSPSATRSAVLAASSSPVAAFGDGADRVEVRRPGGDDPAPTRWPSTSCRRLGPRRQPRGSPSRPRPTAALRGGRVDERLLTLLATVAVGHRVAIDAFPARRPRTRPGAPARTVELGGVDDRPMRGDEPAVAASCRSSNARSRAGTTPPASIIGVARGADPSSGSPSHRCETAQETCPDRSSLPPPPPRRARDGARPRRRRLRRARGAVRRRPAGRLRPRPPATPRQHHPRGALLARHAADGRLRRGVRRRRVARPAQARLR